METEVVIVGAGPAGSTAARELAARGVDVLMLERAKFPRDKPCGGGVTIRCDNLLPFSLDPVIEDVITGAVIQIRDGKAVTRDADAPITYMTQRRYLDRFLVEQAQAEGAEFQDGRRVDHIEQTPDGFEVRVANGAPNGDRNGGDVIHARAVLGADGANGVVRTFLGYEHFEESGVALEAHIAFPDGVPAWLRGRVVLRLAAMQGGYGWIFPKGDHVNIGVGGWKAAAGADLRPQLESLVPRLRHGPGQPLRHPRPPPADAAPRRGPRGARVGAARRRGRAPRPAVGRGHLRRDRLGRRRSPPWPRTTCAVASIRWPATSACWSASCSRSWPSRTG